MDTKRMFVGLSLCALVAPSLAGEFFFFEEDFLASVNVVDTNTFDEVVSGPAAGYSYSSGEYGYGISSSISGGSGLNNGDGYVQLADGNQSMLISMSGAPVTAFSANFWAVDDTGFTGAGVYIIITISNGDEFVHSSTAPDNFFSYASETAFDSIEIAFSGGSSQVPVYAAVDNFLIAQTIPAPGVLAMFGFGGLVATRRRRV